METGGVYASKTSTVVQGSSFKQMVLQFQIEGGNAWAQGIAYGIQQQQQQQQQQQGVNEGVVQLVSLKVANMDASMNGTPYDVPLSTLLSKT